MVRKVTEGLESGLPKIMVHEYDIVIWETNKSTVEKKFQRVVTMSTDFGLSVNLDNENKLKIGSMEEIKYNNH
jgi:hypothetical protein